MGEDGPVTTSTDLTFLGSHGQELSGVLSLPSGHVQAFAVFAHCFTCGKDSFAAARISRALADRGIGVLRFDFTGLGESGGDLADSTFSCDVADLVRAAEFLAAEHRPPSLLVGHSLGGAAVLAAAGEIPSVRAVVTIGAPHDPAHVVDLLGPAKEEIERSGEADVTLGQRTFRMRRGFLDDIGAQPQRARLRELNRALLVLHAPGDEVVGIDNARLIFDTARHPKSFISLDGADHLLSDRADSVFAADIISTWASRYLEPAASGMVDRVAPSTDPGVVTVRSRAPGPYTQSISAGSHILKADEPTSVGGADSGPNPYDLLLASLGACTAMTLRMYADRKGLPLTDVEVVLRHDRIHAADCDECDTQSGTVDHIDRAITLIGDLNADQRTSLFRIADRCPVHRSLTSEVHITTRELAEEQVTG
jgi:putative redox protein